MSTKHQGERVRLVDVGTFAPRPDRWARISLVWWDAEVVR